MVFTYQMVMYVYAYKINANFTTGLFPGNSTLYFIVSNCTYLTWRIAIHAQYKVKGKLNKNKTKTLFAVFTVPSEL